MKVQLNATGYVLPAGNRWRLSISPTYWPHAWPSPHPATLRIFTGEPCRLDLPLRRNKPVDESLTPFQSPENSPELPAKVIRTGKREWLVNHDVIAGKFTITDSYDYGRRQIIANGLVYDSVAKDTYLILQDQPQSAAIHCERSVSIERGNWRVRVESYSTMTGDSEVFRITNVLDGYEGDTRVFTKSWTASIPRDLV